METLNLVQGSPEWHHFRNDPKVKPASELPAVMGLSPYKKRDELLKEYATGIREEVDAATQARFDKGHEFEAAMRPVAEKVIGEELYQATGYIEKDGMIISASFDGITMLEDLCYEHKTINQKLRECKSAKDLPPYITVQMDQQLLVCGGEKCLFIASNGTEEDMVQFWYKSTKAKKDAVLKAWKQFDKDLETYQIPEAAVEVTAAPIQSLPALAIRIEGKVLSTNLDTYKKTALDFIAAINTDLKTDEDFANAEEMVKFCDKAEKELDTVKKMAQAQAVDIDTVFRAIDEVKATMRQKRLDLEKLVKAKKDRIRAEIIAYGNQRIADHIHAINQNIAPYDVNIRNSADFHSVIKGKQKLDSIRDAINTEVARVKIELDDYAELIAANAKEYKVIANGYESLFPDIQTLIHNAPEFFALQIKNRIQEHQDAEERRRQAEAKPEDPKDPAPAAAMPRIPVGDSAQAPVKPIMIDPNQANDAFESWWENNQWMYNAGHYETAKAAWLAAIRWQTKGIKQAA